MMYYHKNFNENSKRWDVINTHCEGLNAKKYLEIGYQYGNCFDRIECSNKTVVDPEHDGDNVHKMTSDDFFSQLDGRIKYDVVFIDGLHHADQVERDIINSCKHLTKKGVIILHDCHPTSEEMQQVPRVQREWTGDVWRAFVGFRLKYPEVVSYCYDFDYGVGVIHPNGLRVEPGFITKMSYNEFHQNRHTLSGIIRNGDR